ncbi:MAG: 6-phosphogluconolactonase [bacterium]
MNYKIDVSTSIEELSEKFANILKQGTAESDSYFTVALSGGSTPKVIFNYLAENFKTKIDWNKIKFFWVDERCVTPDDTESNYGMTKKYFFDKIDIPGQNIFRIRGEDEPLQESERYSKIILENVSFKNKFPQFDLIVLGIGEDGHTASIFPGRLDLFDSNDICDTTEHPQTGQKRITLNGKVINNAKKVVFLVTGKSKKAINDIVLNRKDGFEKLPVAFICPIDGELIWMLDAEAVTFEM